MNISKEFQELIQTDIKRIEDAISSNLGKGNLLNLHKEIDCRYQSCITNWYQGLNEVIYLQGRPPYLEYAYLDDYKKIVENLSMWKAKLEVYKFGKNAVVLPETPATNVNVTTNVSLNITFEQVRSQIEDMTSLTDKETTEIMEKIAELEEIINSKDKKKNKWEKAKSVLVWLADKSFDVGMAMLPLLLKIQS